MSLRKSARKICRRIALAFPGRYQSCKAATSRRAPMGWSRRRGERMIIGCSLLPGLARACQPLTADLFEFPLHRGPRHSVGDLLVVESVLLVGVVERFPIDVLRPRREVPAQGRRQGLVGEVGHTGKQLTIRAQRRRPQGHERKGRGKP
jgi:hypothetical protein